MVSNSSFLGIGWPMAGSSPHESPIYERQVYPAPNQAKAQLGEPELQAR
jgi:hypothetical protein